MVKVYGSTYQVKEALKSECRAKWNANDKAWYVPADMALIAQAIVARGMSSDEFYKRGEFAAQKEVR